MSTTHKLLLALSSITTVLGCQTELEIDLPVEPSRLVVHSLLIPDTTNYIYVGKSTNILDLNLYEWSSINSSVITDANVYVKDTESGEVFACNYHEDAEGYLLEKGAVKSGNRLELVAEHPNHLNVSAQAGVPLIISAELISVESTEIDNEDRTIFRIKINDNGNKESYYLIRKITQEHDENGDLKPERQLQSLRSDYPGSTMIYLGNSEVLFSNSLFSKSNEIEVYDSYGDFNYRHTTEIIIYHITKDYYTYLVSAELNTDNQGNPLGEPVQIASNINNGFGVLGSASFYRLKVPQFVLSGK